MAEPYLTVAEIEAKYPNQWVFVTNPKLTKSQEVIGGIVIIHSNDRMDFWRMIGEWDDPEVKHTASWYTGKEIAEVIEPVETEPGAA